MLTSTSVTAMGKGGIMWREVCIVCAFTFLAVLILENRSVQVTISPQADSISTPWVEAICIAADAGSITTVDFNPPVVSHPRIKSISIEQLDAMDDVFDVIVSFSSIEHDGLGRYGDPMNPTGDLQRMKKIQGLVKPEGLFYLGVPVGNDTIAFNAHRVYGPLRMPKLIEGWKHLDTIGGKLEDFYTQYQNGIFVQQILVLHFALKSSGSAISLLNRKHLV
ncbi:unnamed protein product [Closterium sp. Yama58-4]|nr:unnamed protein product [Closterium sp. Yama58-4]